jgi:S1-C subfamily serine protease
LDKGTNPGTSREGSGVIISEDGYIVTNNHVIKEPRNEITLNNKKSYKAKLIGTDSKMDIALLKLMPTKLAYTTFGNSDSIKSGNGFWQLETRITLPQQ